MSNVFHLVVTVDYVDTRVDQSQVGTQLHVACIEHIGEQGQVIFVAVAGHVVVLIGQFHTFFLSAEVGVRGKKRCVSKFGRSENI